jgi:hypothetical protein
MATTRAIGQKPHERLKALRNMQQRSKAIRNSIQRQKNKEKAVGRKSISEQQAIERLGLRNLSPRSKKRVIQGKAPVAVANMSLENYGAMVLKAYQETQAEKIQAAYRGMRNRKKVRKMKVNQRKMKVNQLENKEKKLLQRRNLLQQQDRIRGELNAMSPNSPSPPRARSLRARAKNPSPREARYYNKLKQLYTTGRAKKVEEAKMAYKKKMMKNATMKPNRNYINNPVYTKKMMELRARPLKEAKKARAERIEKRRVKRKRPRQAQKPRKKKKPTSSPTIAQIQRNILAANSPTIAQIQRNLLAANRSPRRRKRSRVLPKPNAATAKNARRARIEKRRGLIQIKKRYTLTDLISGKKKTFTKKGWYDRAVAKQQSLRERICA